MRSNLKHRRFYLYFATKYFFIYMPFLGLFLLEAKNMSNNQILFFFAVYSYSVVFFEVPTGLIADRFGEKWAICVGSAFRAISVLLLICGNVYLIFLSQIVFAIGDSFASGADHSLLYSHCTKTQPGGRFYDSVVANVNSFTWGSLAFASLAGFFAFRLGTHVPFYINFVAFALNFLVSLLLPNIKKERKTRLFDIAKASLIQIFTNREVRLWLAYSALMTALIASAYLILQPLLNELNLAGPTNGLIFFSITSFGFIGSLFGKKVLTQKIILTSFGICIVLCISISGMMNSDTTIAIAIFVSTLRFIWAIADVFFVRNINTSINTDELRSSILSYKSLFTSLFQALLLSAFTAHVMSIGLSLITVVALLILVSTLFVSLYSFSIRK